MAHWLQVCPQYDGVQTSTESDMSLSAFWEHLDSAQGKLSVSNTGSTRTEHPFDTRALLIAI